PEVMLLDAATGREVNRLPGAGVVFCPDRSILVTWQDDRVTGWDARTFAKKYELRAAAPLRGLELTFSRDGSLLLGPTKSGRGHRWEAKPGRGKATGDGFQPRFAADGKTLLTHLPGGVVKLWDPASGQERTTLRPVEQGGCWAEFTADGKHLLTVPAWFTLKP